MLRGTGDSDSIMSEKAKEKSELDEGEDERRPTLGTSQAHDVSPCLYLGSMSLTSRVYRSPTSSLVELCPISVASSSMPTRRSLLAPTWCTTSSRQHSRLDQGEPRRISSSRVLC
jgi:hypothetical protein